MNTQKQNKANKANALLSTGPITEAGKAVVSLNAIKHGVFAKDLIIDSEIGKENIDEYNEILNNLISCLSPQNQIESLLVEKIVMDFWRLRRVIRFEAGSIQKYLEETINNYYDSYSNKTNETIENDITNNKYSIKWNIQYIECLKNGLVSFDKLNWKGKDIESDIIEDFYMLANAIDYNKKTKEERNKLYNGEYDFIEIRKLLNKYGYSTDKEISSRLIELCLEQNRKLEEEIQKLEQKKMENIIADELNAKVCSIPQDNHTDKIMKYEKSIQKSIFQNLLLLKKLQHEF